MQLREPRDLENARLFVPPSLRCFVFLTEKEVLWIGGGRVINDAKLINNYDKYLLYFKEDSGYTELPNCSFWRIFAGL